MWSRSDARTRIPPGQIAAPLLACGVVACGAGRVRGLLAPWLQQAVSGTAIEAAVFRTMDLPYASVLFPRPPAESVTELDGLVAAAPSNAALLTFARASGREPSGFPKRRERPEGSRCINS